MIFIDINKENYADSLPVIVEKLRPGGLLIVDNMLWHVGIFDPQDQTPATASIRALTGLDCHAHTGAGWSDAGVSKMMTGGVTERSAS